MMTICMICHSLTTLYHLSYMYVHPQFSRLDTSVGLPFVGLGVPEQALGGIPLGFGIIVEDKPSELSQEVYYSNPHNNMHRSTSVL